MKREPIFANDFGVHADPVIPDDKDEVAVFAPRRQRYFAVRREFDGVRQEIDEDLLDRARIKETFGQILGDVDDKAKAGFVRLMPDDRGAFMSDRAGVRGDALKREALSVDLRTVENGVDEIKQVASRHADMLRILRIVLMADGAEGLALDRFRKSDDGVERRLHLVREIGEHRGAVRRLGAHPAEFLFAALALAFLLRAIDQKRDGSPVGAAFERNFEMRDRAAWTARSRLDPAHRSGAHGVIDRRAVIAEKEIGQRFGLPRGREHPGGRGGQIQQPAICADEGDRDAGTARKPRARADRIEKPVLEALKGCG